MSAPLSTLATVLAAQAATAHAAHPHHHNAVMHFVRHLGLVGLFFVSIVDSSFVPLPIPGVTDIMVILYAASKANLFLVVGIATIGSALGGWVSYEIGQKGGKQFLEKHVPARILKRVTNWMDSHAILSVALPAILPPPMPLSPFVLAAGAGHMSRKKFLWAFTLSRFVRHIIAAWLGVHYGKAVLRIWNQFSSKWGTTILIVLWAVILTFTAIGIWKLYQTSRRVKLDPSKSLDSASHPA